MDLKNWLARRSGLFWITGRPGSGKSMTMKYLYDNTKTSDYLESGDSKQQEHRRNSAYSLPFTSSKILSDHPETGRVSSKTGRCRIGLFITNRGSEDQQKWQSMLHGLLYQLLSQRYELIRDLMNNVVKKKSQARTSSSDNSSTKLQEVYEWTTENIEGALRYCKKQKLYPFKALVLLDGLDELAGNEGPRQCVSFLKELTETHNGSPNIIKVCLSSRSEHMFLDLLSGIWRIEIHEHTRKDIREHVLSRFRRTRRFRDKSSKAITGQLEEILEYISDHARGVFLWASSVCNVVNVPWITGRPSKAPTTYYSNCLRICRNYIRTPCVRLTPISESKHT